MKTHITHNYIRLAYGLLLAVLIASALPPMASAAQYPAAVAVPGSAERFYKLTIGASGLYAVTYEALAAAGVPVDTLDPTTFQVFEQGQEVSRLLVDANRNGRFEPGDAVLFYGRAVDTDFTSANIYWLTYGYGAGLAMAERAATPDPGLPAVATFRETIHLEENTHLRKGLPLTGPADRWYWNNPYQTSCRSGRPGIWPPPPADPWLSVALAGVATGPYTATFTPRVRGFTDVPVHTAIFDINGTVIGQAEFSYKNEFTGSFDFDQAILNEGANKVTLTAPCVTPTTSDIGTVNWYELTYQRTYAAPAAGQFHFAVDANAPVSVTLTGLPDMTARVYDVTDPRRPVMLTGVQATGADLTLAHTLAAPARYVAAAASQYLTPSSIAPDAPSQLRAPAAGADWIIISHRDFISEAERLAAHRRQYQFYRTAVVDVQDVYDEFNGGLMDQEAIRNFLRYAYETWPRPAPRFVVLLGDGHYDPRGRSWNYNGAPYFIPPYLAPIDPFEGLAAADNRYVAYDPPPGQPNPLPFMHLGRLPANTLADATAMVDKIIAYEMAPAHGDWNTTAVFVADNADAGGAFPDSSNLVATDPYYLPGYGMTGYELDGSAVVTTTNPISLTLATTATVTLNFGFQQPPAAAFLAAAAGRNGQPIAVNSVNTILGRIWEDLDGDATPDVGEVPIPNIGVCLYRDPNFNGKIDATDPLISCLDSDSNGEYRFAALPDDHYLVAVNKLDTDFASFFQRRALYCDRVSPTQSSTFFCTPDGGTTRLSVTAASANLVDLINQGALFVNYHGHASVDKWADESLLRTSDLTLLNNRDRYPIMLPMTCLEGQYIDLFTASFGESIVRLPGAGAVASWSPTGKGTSNGHEIIWTAFYEAIFEKGERLIGPATTYAKEALFNSSRIFKDLIDAYILFGDPAMPLDLPAADVWLEKSVVPDMPWRSGQAVTYTLAYGNAGAVTATGVRLTDTLPSDIANRAWRSSDAGVTALTGPDYVWQLPDLVAGARGIITVTGTYSPSVPGSGTVTNIATIASDAWERPAHRANNTGVVAPLLARIGGYLYEDLDNDALFDPGVEPPFVGEQVIITDSNGNVVATPISDAAGHYLAIDLPAGTYTVTAPATAATIPLATPSPLVVSIGLVDATDVNFGYARRTGIEIEDAHAVWLRDGARVSWRTRVETMVQEFNVYRSASQTEHGDKLNADPIWPAAPPGEGADYRFVDNGVTPEAEVFYWLQVVRLDGGADLWIGPLRPIALRKVFLSLVLRQN